MLEYTFDLLREQWSVNWTLTVLKCSYPIRNSCTHQLSRPLTATGARLWKKTKTKRLHWFTGVWSRRWLASLRNPCRYAQDETGFLYNLIKGIRLTFPATRDRSGIWTPNPVRVPALLFSPGRISSQLPAASRFSPVLLCAYQILIPSVVSVILALAFLRVRHVNNKAFARRKPKHVKATQLHIIRTCSFCEKWQTGQLSENWLNHKLFHRYSTHGSTSWAAACSQWGGWWRKRWGDVLL